MAGQIRYESKNGVALLTLDQPDKLNAMSLEMWLGLNDCVDRADADPDLPRASPQPVAREFPEAAPDAGSGHRRADRVDDACGPAWPLAGRSALRCALP